MGTYNEIILKNALEQNCIDWYLIGGGPFSDVPDRNYDYTPVNYEGRLYTVCTSHQIDKEEVSNLVAQKIIEFLKGNAGYFITGICYVKAYCRLIDQGYSLDIDDKEFFEQVRKIIISRKKEIQGTYEFTNHYAWKYIEFADKKAQIIGQKLI